MATIKASNFNKREELEKYVRDTFGLTIDIKPDVSIVGSDKDLARLQLSDTTMFWGIRCASSTPKENISTEKANRTAKLKTKRKK